MIRMFEKKIAQFITDKIPDKAKLFLFFGTAFCIGYTIGDFCYSNYREVTKIMCMN